MSSSKAGRGAILQLVALGVSDQFVSSVNIAPYNAEQGDILNPLEGRVPTKHQWQVEVRNKMTNFEGLHYSTDDSDRNLPQRRNDSDFQYMIQQANIQRQAELVK